MLFGDCIQSMGLLPDGKISCVITSPPYNLNVQRKSGDMYNLKYTADSHADCMDNAQYIDWQISVFKAFDRVLSKNGAILYNINYGGENNETLWLLLGKIIEQTPFTIADQLVWRKKVAIPNNGSRNKVTRICENIFVICRKSEYLTFHSNKKVVSVSRVGQKFYENVHNLIEAPNNNQGEHTKQHKATFSTELVEKLISMYVPEGGVVLDPFSGTGTTAVACINTQRKYVCIEKGESYHNLATERVTKHEQSKI